MPMYYTEVYRHFPAYSVLKNVQINSKKKKSEFAPQIFPCCSESAMMKVAEEYYWMKTQAAGPSFCGRSGSGVLEPGFQLDCLVRIYIFFSTICIIQFGLAPDHPERN
jgi:hypothetical protein